MKVAIVYQRKKELYVDGMSQTTAGVWIPAGPCEQLPVDTSNETLGRTIRAALHTSRLGGPHPAQEEFSALVKPLLHAAGVKSYSIFERGALAVDIKQDETGALRISPTQNRGSAGGFVPQAGETFQGAIDAELGLAVRRALSASC